MPIRHVLNVGPFIRYINNADPSLEVE